MTDKISRVALSVFDETENRPDENQDTSHVQNHHDRLPRRPFPVLDGGHQRLPGGITMDTPVYDSGDDDEDTEKYELDTETTNGDVFARVHCADGAAGHDTTACSYVREGN